MEKTDNQEEKIKRFISVQKHFDLKQKEFADRIGLTQSKVSLIKNGKAGTNILNEIFYRLHYEFGISKDWWENGAGSMFFQNVEKNVSESVANDTHSFDDSGGWKSKYDELHRKYTELLEKHTALLTNKLEEIIKDKRAI